MSAIQKEQEYPKVVPFELIVNKNKTKEKEVKYNKDGSIKKVTNNKVAGKDSEVYAFRTKEEIESMINVFNKHIEEAENNNQRQIACRNKMLFLVGMNVGIRASDLATLRYSFFLEAENDGYVFKDCYKIMPKKTSNKKKYVKLFFNQTVRTAINNYIEEYPFNDLEDFLFPSRKGDGAITPKTIGDIIKKTAEEAGVKQNICSHSLRKSFGYHCFHEAEDKSRALVMLQNIFRHSSSTTTMAYIGLLDNEIEDMFHSIDLGGEFI